MKKKIYNEEHFEGIIYEHNLALKTVQNRNSENFGKEFISGTIDIAVDDEGKNIVQNHFTYVTATTQNGGANATFAALKKIIEDNRTWLSVGKEDAQKVKINSTKLLVNDFVNREGEMISAKRNEGGFVTLVNAITPNEYDRHSFKFDMVISGVVKKEADEEKGTSEYNIVKGGVFNFRNEWQPVELIVESDEGMSYFEGLEASSRNPVFTQVLGTVNTYKDIRTIVEETAFGGDAVRTIESNRKVWVIEKAIKDPYDFGEDGEDLTTKELQEILQNRETYLATVRKRDEEYRNSRTTTSFAQAATTTPAGEFNF